MARQKKLTHLGAQGEARMVDVSAKPMTEREAVAAGCVVMQAATLEIVRKGDAKKGDVLGTARIAGIMAAKRTHELIPLCHPLAIAKIEVDLTPNPKLPGIDVRARVKVAGKTGVEMEALTAVSVACLTVYDMVKAIDRGMRIEGIGLIGKGGRSGASSRCEGVRREVFALGRRCARTRARNTPFRFPPKKCRCPKPRASCSPCR